MQQPHSPLAASCFSSCLLPSIFEGGFRLPAIAVHPVFQGVPTLPSLMGDTSGLSLSLACDLLIFCFTPILFLCFPLSAIVQSCRQDEGMYGGSSFICHPYCRGPLDYGELAVPEHNCLTWCGGTSRLDLVVPLF